jgi:hypothetical protein
MAAERAEAALQFHLAKEAPARPPRWTAGLARLQAFEESIVVESGLDPGR